MRRELATLKAVMDALKQKAAGPSPVVRYAAPADDAAAVELFAAVRAGDEGARDRLQALIRERGWVGWVGDLGRQATGQLIWAACGGGEAWKAGIALKADALHAELLGERPSVLAKLLPRRVLNGWLAVHALELEPTVRPPADARDRAHLDVALTRAEAVRRGHSGTRPRPPAAGAADPGPTERRRRANGGQRLKRRTGRAVGFRSGAFTEV